MIPVKDTLVDIDNLPGEEIAFGIGDPRWVMKTQADLYSDITTAIIREYSTNAFDAHVMAGNPDPIEVTLPSVMDPYFIVEDKGVGMDMDIFRRVYTQFGVSNKRESNDTNGMLGYGSKSGVAYTTQFKVTTIKDGVKIHGVVRRKPDWEIVLKVVSTTRTNEPNGTRIEIPVHNVREFVQKANDFYMFWLPGRVKVNGAEPVHHVGDLITEGFYHSRDWNTSYVVMGNVPYRIANPAALFSNTNINHINFVAYVDTIDFGDGEQAAVEFTPSREDLKYTEHTKNTLHRIVRDFEAKIVEKASSDINDAANHAEAFEKWDRWRRVLGARSGLFDNLEYKGDKFESQFDIEGTRWGTAVHQYSTNGIKKWNIESMASTLIITELDIQVSSSVKARTREYMGILGKKFSYVIFTRSKSDDIQSVWLDKSNFVKWEDLKAALPPKPKKTAAPSPFPARLKGSFDVITKDGREDEVDIASLKGDVMFLSVQDEKEMDVRFVLRTMDIDATVVIVPANRRAKFLRENDVEHFIKAVKPKVILDGASLLSEDQKFARGADHHSKYWLKVLDESKITDPDLAHRIKVVKGGADASEYDKHRKAAKALRLDFKGYSESFSWDITSKYPVLGHLHHWSVPNDIHIYLNAVHEAAEKENN